MNRLMRIINSPEEQSEVDPLLVWSALALLLIGLIMVYSASIAFAEGSRMFGRNPNYFLIRHAIFLMIGLGAAGLAFQVPTQTLQRWSP